MPIPFPERRRAEQSKVLTSGCTKAIGNFAKLPNATLNHFVAVWVVTRAAYTVLYLNTGSKAKSFIRTVVFNVGIYYIMRIWFLALKALY